MTDTLTTVLDTNRKIARTALEQVCPTGNMALAAKCYAENFADHVGTVTFDGLKGVRRSTDLYRRLLKDLVFGVVEQIAEDDRVVSRYVVTGRHRGRHVRLSCVTISRLDNGRIVEDHSSFDTLEVLKQIGLWRTLLLAPRMLHSK